MQHDAADHLHVEMALAEHALGGLAHGGEGFGQEIVERFALGQAVAQPAGARGQFRRRSSASRSGSSGR